MDYNKGVRGSFGGSIFILSATGVFTIILLTVTSFIFGPLFVEGAEKMRMDSNSYEWIYDPNKSVSQNQSDLIPYINEATDDLRETSDRLKQDDESEDSYGCFIGFVVGNP